MFTRQHQQETADPSTNTLVLAFASGMVDVVRILFLYWLHTPPLQSRPFRGFLSNRSWHRPQSSCFAFVPYSFSLCLYLAYSSRRSILRLNAIAVIGPYWPARLHSCVQGAQEVPSGFSLSASPSKQGKEHAQPNA